MQQVKGKIGSEVPPSSLRLTHQLSVPPLSFNQFFERLVLALTVFQSVHPRSLIVFPVGVCHNSPAIPPALFVLALISIPVRPAVLALSMLLILTPLANIRLSSIGVHAGLAFELVVPEVSLEHAPLLHQHSSSVFFVIQEFASVGTPVQIAGCPLAVGQVVLPLSLVGVPRNVSVAPVAISHPISKISLVETSIGLDEAALSLTISMLELSLKEISIIELQVAIAMGLPIQQFALIVGSQPIDVDSVALLAILGREGGQLLQARLDSLGEVGLQLAEVAGADGYSRLHGDALVEGGVGLQSLEGREGLLSYLLRRGAFGDWRACLAALLTHDLLLNDLFNSKLKSDTPDSSLHKPFLHALTPDQQGRWVNNSKESGKYKGQLISRS